MRPAAAFITISRDRRHESSGFTILRPILRRYCEETTLSLKVHTTIQPVFVSRNIEQELNVKETKPPIVNQQFVVHGFQFDLCDAGYVGYPRGHLQNRVKGYKQQSSVIDKHEYEYEYEYDFIKETDT